MAAEKALSKEEEAVQVAMKAVFWLCQESLPLYKYQSLLSFLRLLNVPHIEHLQCGEKTNYSSTTSAHGLLQVLSDTVDENITQKVNESPVMTLFTDESTDIVVNHKLATSVRVVDPLSMTTSTFFLTDVRITDATGKGTFQAIKAELDKRQIPVTKIFGLGTDGASVMTRKNRLGTDGASVMTGKNRLGTDGASVMTGKNRLGTDGASVMTGKNRLGTDGASVMTGKNRLGTDGASVMTGKNRLGTDGASTMTGKNRLGTDGASVMTGKNRLGTDGASVMTGKKNGLAGQLMEVNPHVKNTHCSAHSLNSKHSSYSKL